MSLHIELPGYRILPVDRLSSHVGFALAFPRHQADHEVRVSYCQARDTFDGLRRVLNDDGVSSKKLDRDGYQLESRS